MNETTITATELARGLSDVLNRVRYQGERFAVERNGETIAVLEPAGHPTLFTLGNFLDLLEALPRVDDNFAADLEEIHAAQSVEEPPAWPN